MKVEIRKSHVLFIGNGNDAELKGSIHFSGPKNTSDYTLCGITLDGDLSTAGKFTLTEKRVNCQRCIDFFEYCNGLSASEITKGKKRS